MEDLEETARAAADLWSGRKAAKEEMRRHALALLDKHNGNMTKVSEIMGVSRTSLYYVLYGKHGKANATNQSNDSSVRVYAVEGDERKSA